MRLTPQQAEDLKRRKPGLFPRTEAHVESGLPEHPEEDWDPTDGPIFTNPPSRAKRIRQSSRPPNKWEAEFGDRLNGMGYEHVRHQAITFLLANGVKYTPDLTCYVGYKQFAFEVKGFARDDAIVKLKVAAAKYEEITWVLVWREKGQWKEQTVLR